MLNEVCYISIESWIWACRAVETAESWPGCFQFVLVMNVLLVASVPVLAVGFEDWLLLDAAQYVHINPELL